MKKLIYLLTTLIVGRKISKDFVRSIPDAVNIYLNARGIKIK